jgi:hypothetical protein
MKKLIHIGLPKAASSSLQVGLSACDEIVFLGLYPTQNVAEEAHEVGEEQQCEIPYLNDPRIREFYLAFGFEHYSSSEQLQLYQAICSDYADAKKTLFFSYEGFASPMFSEVSPEVKLQRLVACCGDAEFLIVTRNQGDVIKSQYRDWPFDLTVKKGKGLSLDDWCLNELRRTDNMGPLMWFDFGRLLNPLLSITSKSCLHVLLFEDFIHEREQFCTSLSTLLNVDATILRSCLGGVQANRGVSARFNTYRKLRRLLPLSFSMRSVFPRPLLNAVFQILNRGGSESLEYDKKVREELEGYFGSANRSFAKEFNLPLDVKGYWL